MNSTLPAIPDDVRRFVLTSVPSVPYLEAMLLFQKERQKTRNAADLAARLYVAESAANGLLQGLTAAGVIVADKVDPGTFRYAPRDAGLVALIDKLASAYATNLIAISNLIHDQTQRSAVRFAEAFKLRKD
jgi:hypothetical protein